MTDAATADTNSAESLTYEQARRMAFEGDGEARASLAERTDVSPEILYYLAEDKDADVRRRIAANARTPRQADVLLARDKDQKVRSLLAAKVSRLLPGLDPAQQQRAYETVVETVEILARDKANEIREIIAETLKSAPHAPAGVMNQLARDIEDKVSCPVLQFSPVLSDQDLLEILESGCASGRLQAISRRSGLGETVSDAIVRTRDREAVTALLSNASAQIREETLDQLIDEAPGVVDWHAPLTLRPNLSSMAVRKLSAFVAERLLQQLSRVEGLTAETKDFVAREARKRIVAAQRTGPKEPASPSNAEEERSRARELHDANQLTDETIFEALLAGRQIFVKQAIALRADVEFDFVERAFESRATRGITSLAWKAGFEMRLAMQLQLRLAGIPPGQILKPRQDGSYPLSENEMEWQLHFFGSLRVSS